MTYSICVPVYERTYGFREALSSAINVDGCHEIIVLDDNSSHNEFEKIVESMNDKRIKYFRNPSNLGLFSNWNKSVHLASGDYVSILCSDDLIAPDAWSSFLNVNEQSQTDIDVFFGAFAIFNNDLSDARICKEYPVGQITAQWLIEDAVKNGPNFPVMTIVKKEVLKRHPFEDKYHSGNDWLWIYSNAPRFTMHACKQPLNYWRRHENQDANKRQNITMDCWPMMYENMKMYLQSIKSPLYKKAHRRAIGIINSFIINDHSRNGYWGQRLNQKTNNIFLVEMQFLIKKNWLLKNLLNESSSWFFYFNVARILRKIKYYPV